MITIKDLNFYYKKKKPLFNDLQLNIEPGNICGLLGKKRSGENHFTQINDWSVIP